MQMQYSQMQNSQTQKQYLQDGPNSFFVPEVFIFDESNLAHQFSSFLLKNIFHCDCFTIAQLGEEKKNLESIVKGKRVLLFTFLTHRNVWKILKNSTIYRIHLVNQKNIYESKSNIGYCSFILKLILENAKIHHTVLSRISRVCMMIDDFQDWYPTENQIDFSIGVYLLNGKNMEEKFTNLLTGQIDICFELGNQIRLKNSYNAELLLKRSKTLELNYDGEKFSILFTCVDFPSQDICFYLASHSVSGICFIYTFDFLKEETEITISCLEKSGKRAGDLSFYFFGNQGGAFLSKSIKKGLYVVF